MKNLILALLISCSALAQYPPPPLPDNAAQETGGNLDAIKAAIPANGQKTSANSLPVVLASDEPTLPVSGTFWQSTQPISAASLPLPSGAAADSSLSTINSTLGSPFQLGGSIGNSSFGISGSLPAYASTPTFNLGTLNGAATSANQVTAQTSLTSIDSKLTSPLTVSGTFFQGTQPVSIASMPSTPVTGTFWQTTQPVSNAQLPSSLGAKITSGSVAVNIASDQTVPVSGSFFQSTQPVSAASLPLPSGAATSSLQTTGNSSLSTINTTLGTPFQAGGSIGNTSFSSTQGTSPWIVKGLENTISTTITASQTATISCVGMNTVTLNLTSGATAPVNFFASVDGVHYFAYPGVDFILLNGQLTYSTIESKQFKFSCAGMHDIQFQCSGCSGTATVVATANQGTGDTSLNEFFVGQFGVWSTRLQDGSGSSITKGSKASAQSLPVVIASDQASIPVAATLGASSSVIGHVINDASSAVIGHVINDASSAVIGHVINDSGSTTAVTGNVAITAVQLPAALGPQTKANSTAVNIASDQTVPVSGTFFQSTQPVSAVQLPVALGIQTKANSMAVNIASDQTVPVSGTFFQSTQPVSISGNQAVNVAQINGVTPLMGNGGTGTGSQRVTIASDNTAFSVNASPPTLTKGTQSSTGYSVQLLKDAGRKNVNFYATGAASGTTGTETAISLTQAPGTSSTSAANSFTCTSGKTYRITSMTFGTRGNATGTAEVTTFNFRINTGGAVTTSSTPVTLVGRSGAAATALAYDRIAVDLGGDGYEIACDGTLQFGVTANSVFTTNAPTWDVLITGFEY